MARWHGGPPGGWLIEHQTKLRYRVQLWRDRTEELPKWFFSAAVLGAAFAGYAIGVCLMQNL
jgi:hypothetical protein